MNKKILWITQTAVMLALLVAMQAVTRAAGQFVTGSIVNLILAVSVLVGGLWCGLTVAVLSPFLAFSLGIGPTVIQIVPMIAVGNAVLVTLLFVLCRKSIVKKSFRGYLISMGGMVVSAGAKTLALYLLIVRLLLPLLNLPEKAASVMTLTFSWPQLVTALIGGALALVITPTLLKSLGRIPTKD